VSEQSSGGIDPGVIELAGRVFDLARFGATEELAAYVDAGVPADLTNDKGDTLLILSAYHGHADTVAVLLERGADPGRVTTAARRRWPPVPTPTPAARPPGRPRRSSSCRR